MGLYMQDSNLIRTCEKSLYKWKQKDMTRSVSGSILEGICNVRRRRSTRMELYRMALRLLTTIGNLIYIINLDLDNIVHH